MSRRLEGKVALITGASRGLGAAIAEKYAAEGAELLLLARSVSDLEKVDDLVKKQGGKATLIPYDLNHWMGLESLAPKLYEQFGRLDILVGNAAQLGTLSPTPHGAPEEWERLYRVNVLANWALIRAMDPLLRMSSAGRALFVTCNPPALSIPYAQAYWGAYFSTKAALESLVLTYASETTGESPLRVNLMNPGPMATRLRQEAFPGEDSVNLIDPRERTAWFVDLATETSTDHGKVFCPYSLGSMP